jgi:hypothetical protein
MEATRSRSRPTHPDHPGRRRSDEEEEEEEEDGRNRRSRGIVVARAVLEGIVVAPGEIIAGRIRRPPTAADEIIVVAYGCLP